MFSVACGRAAHTQTGLTSKAFHHHRHTLVHLKGSAVPVKTWSLQEAPGPIKARGYVHSPSRLKAGEGPQPRSGPLRPPSAKGKAGRSGPQRQRVRQQPQPGHHLGVEVRARARVGGRSWARTERPSGGPSMQELRRPRQDALMVRQQRAQGHTENREATGQGASQRGQGQRHRSDGDRDRAVTGTEGSRDPGPGAPQGHPGKHRVQRGAEAGRPLELSSATSRSFG